MICIKKGTAELETIMHQQREDKIFMHLVEAAIKPWASLNLEDFKTQEIDWDYLLGEMLHHGLFLIIYPVLKGSGNHLLPESVKTKYTRTAHSFTTKSMRLSAELIRVCDALAACRIPNVPFKGPTLSQNIYGKTDLRIFGDLDVLVRKDDVEGALRCLAEIGFSPLLRFDKDQLQKYLRYEDDLQLTNAAGTLLEMHWETTGRYAEKPVDYEYLEPRLVSLEFHGRTVAQFGTEDLLVYLCLHGARHCWERLEWLASVAKLLAGDAIAEYGTVLEIAEKIGCRRIVLHSLHLAGEVFSIRLPAIVQKSISKDVVLSRLPENSFKKSFLFHRSGQSGKASPTGHRFRLMQLRLRDSWPDICTYLFRQFFWLRVADVQYVRLPSVLFPLYYLIRPYRLILTFLKTR